MIAAAAAAAAAGQGPHPRFAGIGKRTRPHKDAAVSAVIGRRVTLHLLFLFADLRIKERNSRRGRIIYDARAGNHLTGIYSRKNAF